MRSHRAMLAVALLAGIAVVSACGDGETRLDQGLDAADRAEEQSRVIDENQQRLDEVSGLTP